jgi:uncharacterized protein
VIRQSHWPFAFWRGYTRCAMFVVIALALGLAQSAGNAATAQPPPVESAATTVATLSSSEISQLQSKAEAGDANAQVALGKAYQDGNGVPQNDELAVRWYRKAADQGNPEGQNDLGLMYRTGSGVEKSKEEAVNWYRKAARQNYPSAMFNMGTAYYNGDGVGVDDIIAYAWFLLAQERGSKSADDAVRRMSAALSPGERSDALIRIAEMYKKGEELPHDDTAAVKWYRAAVASGRLYASVELANMLIQGRGAAQDYAEARRLCENSAKENYGPGAYCMGLLWMNGLGLTKNPGEAAKWFSRAAEQRHMRAMLYLGEMYWKGIGVRPDKDTAYKWIFIAASSGIPEAKQDQETLEKEMDPKRIGKARANATQWVNSHRGLVIVNRSPK